MRRLLFACALACACIASLRAQDATLASPPDAATAKQLDSVVVHGVQPGPGLWRVSKGDHVLWILGTLTPLPKDMTWNSRHVEAVIATSQEVVEGPEAELKSDAGFFGTLFALPSLVGVRNNPDDRKLADVVPPELYARWAALKRKYMGGNNKVESWRPLFAALELYAAAIHKAHLTDKPIAQKAVESAARHAGVRITTPKVAVTVDSPRAAVKEFKATALDDSDCFRKTLDRIDTDLAAMTARANAWATGDLNALRKLPYTDQLTVCQEALSEGQFTHTRGLDGISARAHQAWLDAVTKALERNKVTFAMLPIARLLQREVYLSRLQAMGYTIEEPASTAGPVSTGAAAN
ncbi:MAG TPA: TraB/GumN family protein [Xanthomonadaceae bacterium]|jgi:hypothetical protein|nr:TraB/GumN family protein [Xanthomonadaceae bacterium]